MYICPYVAIGWAHNPLVCCVHVRNWLIYVYIELQDNVCVKGKYQSTSSKNKHYLKRKVKVLSYCETSRCISKHISTKMSKNNEKAVLHYVKQTNPLSFQTGFPKHGPTETKQQRITIALSDTPSRPHQLLVYIYLLKRAYFNWLEYMYNT